MRYRTAPASDHSADVAAGGFALAPDRVYHAPLLPTEETGREPVLPKEMATSRYFSPFARMSKPMRVSIVSVALSLGFPWVRMTRERHVDDLRVVLAVVSRCHVQTLFPTLWCSDFPHPEYSSGRGHLFRQAEHSKKS